jgi:excinuclease ABC subunit C
MTESILDGIPGLGEVRRKKLLKTFGSVKRLREASLEQIEQVPGIPRAVADNVHRTLHGEPVPATDNRREAS